MKRRELQELLRKEIRAVLREGVAVSAAELKEGVPLPFDEGKAAAAFVKLGLALGMKQGPWNNGKPNGDFSFDFEYGDASNSKEVVGPKGQNSEGNNPSTVFILNPKMQQDSRIAKLAARCFRDADFG